MKFQILCYHHSFTKPKTLVLSKSCDALSGIGPILAKKLLQCGICTIADLLFHLPYRYQDRTRITAIADVRANDWVVIAGSVCKVEVKQARKRVLDCFVKDKTGIMKLRFFHFNLAQVRALSTEPLIRIFGEVREFKHQLEMIHPEYQIVKSEESCLVEEYLTPIYPSTQGLSQNRLRQAIETALKLSIDELKQLEWMNEESLAKNQLLPLESALQILHCPPPDTSLEALEQGSHPALKRLAFEELLAQRLCMLFAKEARSQLSAPRIPFNPEWRQRLLDQLPFSLTKAQERVSQEISKDLEQSRPMLRMLQGDVGSGKTIIAALAAIQAIARGYQVALMAPTDILSEQHYQNLNHWFKPLNIALVKLSAKMSLKERRLALAALADGGVQIAVGTHALFQEAVIFKQLALVIIDEQHRFGVEQRLRLQEKGKGKVTPHQLLMTATPIPRTLAMTQLAHLEISTIDELPPGRTPVVTAVLADHKRALLIQKLAQAIASGRQAYWVCTLIEESEKLQCMAATCTAQTLAAELPSVRIGLIHGRMSPVEKEATMTAFKAKELDLLVATTVIEVGVDVPLASLMIIENAERLGLSQLHQLRGRVGRGAVVSHCLLLYQAPLSKLGLERLLVMRQTQDGFLIAQKDLELRGAGEVLGTKQAGYKQFKIAKLDRDKDLLSLLLPYATQLLQEDRLTARLITERWLKNAEQFLQG